jgi:hypothetical protein
MSNFKEVIKSSSNSTYNINIRTFYTKLDTLDHIVRIVKQYIKFMEFDDVQIVIAHNEYENIKCSLKTSDCCYDVVYANRVREKFTDSSLLKKNVHIICVCHTYSEICYDIDDIDYMTKTTFSDKLSVLYFGVTRQPKGMRARTSSINEIKNSYEWKLYDPQTKTIHIHIEPFVEEIKTYLIHNNNTVTITI